MDDLAEKAKNLYNSGDYKQAETVYSQLIKADLSSVRFIINRALCHLKQENYKEAIADLQTAIQLDNKNQNAWFLNAKAHYGEGNTSINATINCLVQAIEIDICNADVGNFIWNFIIKDVSSFVEDSDSQHFLSFSSIEQIETEIKENGKFQTTYLSLLDERKARFGKLIIRLNDYPGNRDISNARLGRVWFVLLNDIGVLYKPLGFYMKALLCHLLILHFLEANRLILEENRLKSLLIGNISLDYKLCGMTEEALKYIDKAIELDKKLNMKEILTKHLHRLAKLHMAMGYHRKAIEVLQESESLARELGLKLDLGRAIGDLGRQFWQLQMFEKSIENLKTAIEMASESKDMEGFSIFTGLLGECYIQIENYDAAIELFNNSYKLFPTPYIKLITIGQLGDSYYRKGEAEYENSEIRKELFNKAKDCLTEAWNGLEKSNDWNKVTPGLSLAQVYWKEQNNEIAKLLFEKCIAASEDGKFEQNYAEVCAFYGTFLLKCLEISKAIEYLNKAELVNEKIWRDLNNDQYIITWSNSVSNRTGSNSLQMAHISLGDIKTALEVADSTRSRSLRVELSRKRKVAEKRLNFDCILEIATKSNSLILYFSQVQTDILFVWALFPGNVYKFLQLIPSDIKPALSDTLGPEFIDKIRGIKNDDLTRTFEIPTSQSSKGSLCMIWEELEPLLKTCSNISQIVFVPDSKIEYGSFSALNIANDELLIDRFSYFVVPCLSIGTGNLSSLSEKVQLSGGSSASALVIGNPDLSEFRLSEQSLAQIPLSELECTIVKEQLKHFNDVQCYTNLNATKSRVLQVIDKVNIFHIASHALLHSKQKAIIPGALVLSPEPGTSQSSTSGYLDCFLTSEEIQQLDLTNMDLAFLNCCNSGQGRVYSEGLMGLGRAFLFAGAKAVILSQWEVIDCEETCELVKQFYIEYNRSREPHVALRAAQLHMKNQGIREEIWAPFFVYTQIG